MPRIVVYRANGTEVVPRSRWQRAKLTALGFLGAVVLFAILIAAAVIGLMIAIPLIAAGLILAVRMYWRLRVRQRLG